MIALLAIVLIEARLLRDKIDEEVRKTDALW